jgi:pimeloyl-ACP methyl ester carboxylesterase
MSSARPTLPFAEHNTQARETILLVHGAFGDRHEWDLVIPYLSNYHLLVADLPGHGEVFADGHFSVPVAARMLHDLIVQHAHDQVAHIVGLSLGANVGIQLVANFPECIRDVLVSGFQVSPQLPAAAPYAIWAMQRVEWVVPRFAIRWLMDGADLRRPDLSKCTLEACRDIFIGDPAEPYSKWPEAWPARTLVIAAGKSGILPTSDSPDDARRLADIGRRTNPATRAVSHPDIRHPWFRQLPRMFAETIEAWLEERDLPAGFGSL